MNGENHAIHLIGAVVITSRAPESEVDALRLTAGDRVDRDDNTALALAPDGR